MLQAAGFGYAFGAPNPVLQRLQRAVALLGLTVNDSALATKDDGIPGPNTTRVVNRALKLYTTTAPASMRTGILTTAQISAQASAISGAIEAEVNRRGAPSKRVPAPVAARQQAARPTPSDAVSVLQGMLRRLGVLRGDSILTSVAPAPPRPPDGLIGPKTTTAANRALVRYATNAPANLRTGKLSQAEVVQNVRLITQAVEAAVLVAKAKPPVVAKKVTTPPKVKVLKSAAVATLQERVRQLGGLVKDNALLIGVDGLIGPKTTAATNRALQKYAEQAPASYRTGKLPQAQVFSNAAILATLVGQAVTARGVQPALPPPVIGPDVVADIPPGGDVPVPPVPVPPVVGPVVVQIPPVGPGGEPPIGPGGEAPPPVIGPVVTPPVGPGGEIPGGGGGEPPPPVGPGGEQPPPAVAEKKFPWIWVIGGGIALVGIVGTVLIMRKPSGRLPASEPRRTITRRTA